MDNLSFVPFYNVTVNDGFWKNRMEINEKVTIYSVRDRFRDTGRFEAFKFNWKEGSDLPRPHIFWDSDVAKWMESVAYILAKKDVPELKADVEELISLMEKNQQEDGYFNIAHTVVHPEKKFVIRDNHELYCLGHFIEAAVAWKKATGSDRLLNVVDKYIELVVRVFKEEGSAEFVTPGHEEIELALIKLYRLSGNKKYLDLAMFFIDERGKREEYVPDWCNSAYNQSHLPVREQKEAMGHCVRACYLYSAMADAAKETGDKALFEACKALFDDIVNKKMYISGGIGSSHHGEAFTIPYDLPSDTAYAETCAAISLMMFADRMKDIEPDSRYADIVERELYNGILAGISLDGKSFFYENPLEIKVSDRKRHTSLSNPGVHYPITQRQEVFSCSCCPPNITRFFASIGDHIFSVGENSLYLHQFISCSGEADGMKINVETAYPSDGAVRISVAGAGGKRIFIRIPAWCENFCVSESYTVENGYARIDVDSDIKEINVNMPMKARFYVSSAAVSECAGKVALMYGPVLYCLEQSHNENDISAVFIDADCKPEAVYSDYFGCNVLKMKAFRQTEANGLYIPLEREKREVVDITLTPYFGFANNGESDMKVWLNR